MQHKITNDIYRELIKCNRSAYFSISKPEKVVSDKQIQINLLKFEMADRVSNSLNKNEYNIKTNFNIQDGQGLESVIDCLVTKNGTIYMYCCFPVNYKISKYEIQQAAYCHYVASKCGIKIDKIVAVRYKNAKDKEGTYSEDNFYYENITGSVANAKRQKIVYEQIQNLFSHIKLNSAPKFSPHHYCIKPYVCPLKKYCFEKGIGKEESVFDLTDARFSARLRLYWKNIIKIENIDRKYIMPKNTETQIEVYTKKREKVLKQALLDRYKYVTKSDDFLALDIDYCEILTKETNADRSSTKLPFVFNLHVCISKLNASSDDFEIIRTSPTNDTAKELIRKLIGFINSYNNLNIVVYNKNKVFTPLMRLFEKSSEEYNQLFYISHKVFDLYEIFLNKDYYHPSFRGSSYLKDISKITSPDVYKDSDIIKNGIQAENYFKQNTAHGAQLSDDSVNELYKYLTRDVLVIINTNKFIMNKL